MKTQLLSKGGALILALIIAATLLLASCSSQVGSVISSPSTSTGVPPSTTAANPTNPTSIAPAAKTVKIGLVFWLGSDIGLDAVRSMQLMAEDDNKNGGLTIGGEKYNVQLISYDSNNDQATETAAVNRLIFEDKVNYIISQGIFESGWLQTTESNKIIVMCQNPMAAVVLGPNTRYTYNPTFSGTEIPSKIGWFCQTYPEKVKNMVLAFTDNQFGHMVSGLIEAQFKAFGVTPTILYYPAEQQDLSAVATKVASLKPTAFMTMNGNSATIDALMYKTVFLSGVNTQFFTPTDDPISTWTQVIPISDLEGFICGMYCTEVDPALTETSQHFKELWKAKYGSWTDPQTVQSCSYPCLRTALQQAGSLDTDKVAAVLNNGMKYSTATGDGKMIARPDIGTTRTADSVSNFYMKQIVNGKIQVLATIPADEAQKLFQIAFPPLPPGAQAPAGPPPGGAP
jgi:branched-chain amino acid transport system substrate-binding protein